MKRKTLHMIIDWVLIFAILVSLIAVIPVYAATYEAKIGSTKYSTLEAAVSAASAGNTIVLLSDVVLESTLTISKALTITTDGLASYTISGTQSSGKFLLAFTAAVTMKGTGDGSRIIVDGKNKTHDRGLVYLNANNCTLEYVTVQNNTSTYSYGGGGIYTNKTGIVLNYCTIQNNTATGDSGGGGMYLTSAASVEMTRCTITNNTASVGKGGGIYIAGTDSSTHGNCTAHYCTISNNTARVSAPAVRVGQYGTFTPYGCTFDENTAPSHGSSSAFSSLPTFTGTRLGYVDGSNNSNNCSATSGLLGEVIYQVTPGGDTYSSYRTKLLNAGFTQRRSTSIDDNTYTVFTDSSKTVTLMDTPRLKNGTVRILVENTATLPNLDSPSGTAITTPSVTMIGTGNTDNQNGMSFLYRLSDGRFIIVDGGYPDSSSANTYDARPIYDAMVSLSGSSTVTVAAWFLTHIHNDHVGAFCSFWESSYSSNVTIEKVILNTPNETTFEQNIVTKPQSTSFADRVNTILSGFPSSVKKIKAHPGQVFNIGDARITMLYTAELMAPDEVWNFNDTTTIFTVELGGLKFMQLGDCAYAASKVMTACYPNALKSDVLQVAHHGFYNNVVIPEIYQKVAAEYALWPCTYYRYEEHSGNQNAAANKWLFKQRDLGNLQVWCAADQRRTFTITDSQLSPGPCVCHAKGSTSHPKMTAFSTTSGTLAAGNYYLSANKSLTGNLTVSSGTVNLCLNGHTLNCGSYKIAVTGGTLNICDCSTGKTGTISATNSNETGAIVVSGMLNHYSGTVSNNAPFVDGLNNKARAITVNSGGRAYLCGGTTISANSTPLRIMSGGSVYLSDGAVVTGNYHAFYNSGTIELGNCVVSNNGTSSALYNDGKATVKKGATISGALPISNGENAASNPTLIITGGTINSTGSHAINNNITASIIKLEGAPVINSNAADFNLKASSTITPTGSITGGPYSIKTDPVPTAGNDVKFMTNLSTGMAAADIAKHFVSANGSYAVRAVSNAGYLHIHTPNSSTHVGATPATCSTPGYTGDILCSSCGDVAVYGEVIPTTDHTVVEDATVTPTCTEPGLTAGLHCSVCLQTIIAQEEISALGHNIVIDAAVPATCTAAGLSAGQHCSRCDNATVAQETVPPLGHDIIIDAAVPATCTETGLTAGTHCSVCGEVIKAQEEIPALGHDYASEVTAEATCLTAGVKTYTCTRCNDSYTEEIQTSGHTPAKAVEENRVEATCNVVGHYDTVVYCTVCHAELSRETTGLPMTQAHVPGEAVVENTVSATCVTPGSYELVSYCLVCGERVFCIPGTVPAIGKHTAATPVQENAVPATCTAAGSYESVTYCKDCGTELSRETVTIPATGHQYGAPVDNGNGTHTATCICDDSITEAHSFVNGICICGAEEATFGIVSASLRLDRNIDIIFHATVPEGAQNIKLMVGTENDTVILTDFEKDGSSLRFIYADLNPQQIGDLLTATLSAKVDGRTKFDTLDDYSIRQYCVNLLNDPKYSEDAKLHTLLSDLLAYGAAAQTYMDYKTNALVTDGLNLNPSAFTPISGKNVSFTGTADENTDWTGACLVLSDSVTMRLAFCAASTETLSVRVCINGREETFTAFESDGTGKYYIDFNGIEATEFDDTVSASFYRNGGKIGRTVNYSVNTYICSTQNTENTDLQTLVRALYSYGASAKQYATK